VSDEIIANCGVELVFSPKLFETHRTLSERLGTYTFKARSHSRRTGRAQSDSVTHSDQKRPLMLPDELNRMPAHWLFVLKSGISAVRGNKLVYHEDRPFSLRGDMPPPHIAPRSKDMKADGDRAPASEAVTGANPQSDDGSKPGGASPAPSALDGETGDDEVKRAARVFFDRAQARQSKDTQAMNDTAGEDASKDRPERSVNPVRKKRPSRKDPER